MGSDRLTALTRLTDPELLARWADLAGRGRETTAELVAHVAELDTRDVHLRAGYGSVFVYCCEELGLSEHEAYDRIVVARAARRFPVILEMLADGIVNLASVRILAPHLTPENHCLVLESARGKRKLQVEEIAARLAPQPDVPAVVRRLPDPRPAALPAWGPGAAGPAAAPAAVATAAAPGPPSSIAPLSPFRYRFQLTIGGAVLEKLRLAKDMLRHAIPTGDDAAILDRALTALLAELARRKFAATDAPRPSSGGAPGSRHVPAEVKRAVWLRDLGRCAFVGEPGRRCNGRAFLEFHHVKPYAVGGEASVENVQLRCRRHNDYEARVYFRRPEAVPYR